MTTLHSGSAQILHFPVRPHTVASAILADDHPLAQVIPLRQPRASTFSTLPPAMPTVAGAWYHDEAVQEAAITRKSS
jgi:hypothetical protein